jgi:hypothetical protein
MKKASKESIKKWCPVSNDFLPVKRPIQVLHVKQRKCKKKEMLIGCCNCP